MKFFSPILFVCVVVVIASEEYNERIGEALCRLKCYDETESTCSPVSKHGCECDEYVEDSIKLEKYADAEPTLKCKSQDMISVEWKKDISPYEQIGNNTAYFLHVISLYEENFTDVTFCNHYTIEKLQANETYQVNLWGVDDEKRVFVSNYLTVNTTEKGFIPTPVSNVSLNLIPDVSSYQAMVEWIPGPDLSCYYEIILYCTSSEKGHDPIPAPGHYEITKPSELFKLHVNELQFGYSYTLSIRAKTAELEYGSTDKTIHFVVPTCLQALKNLTICAPDEPQNLTVTEIPILKNDEEMSDLYDILLEWKKPELLPNYYLVTLKMVNTALNNIEEIPALNISGSAVNATFKDINLTSYYQIMVTAVSEGGVSTPAIAECLSLLPKQMPPTKQGQSNVKIFLFLLPLIVVIIIILFLSVPKRGKPLNTKVTTCTNKYETGDDKNQNQMANRTQPDKWELSMENLNFKTVLGEGAFGVVWQAMIDHTPVACKTLKENCTADEVRQLQQEIEIMKYVGSHPNIVSMVGCITQNVSNGPILVVEYCSRGNLLNYLRTVYDNVAHQLDVIQKDDHVGKNDVTNKLYQFNVNQDDEQFTEMDILSFGRQIAMGMEYLSSQKVLHRDLAARNILMCDDKRVKVSDFGLSRDVYMDSIYCKTSNGKLPIRWMALESLTHQIYTSQSDVWSFGILLWEIASLGAIPYAGVETHELLAMLKRGERMSKPVLCSADIYSIMLRCWKELPNERPTFSSLREEFETLLTQENHYLNLNTSS